MMQTSNTSSAIAAAPLPRSFYERPTLIVARELLGKHLVRRMGEVFLVGKIVETEAYIGQEDPACHAARGKTARTALMFGPPGFAYIYFIYGMYYCLNAVTESHGFPAAVLIRAVEPLQGVEQMSLRRGTRRLEGLTSGPGKLCQAFGLDSTYNGADLCGDELYICPGESIPRAKQGCSPRVGISVGKEHPWRFFVKNNRFVSGGRKQKRALTGR